MERLFIADKYFEKQDFTPTPLQKGDYECCNFVNCNLEKADISGINFAECEFTGCNISMANISKASFKDVQFKNCKMLGLHFNSCNSIIFSVSFDSCTLNFSSFFKLKLKSTQFINSNLQEVDFTEANLSTVKFDNCNLQGAIFENTNLEKTDFRTASNYSIDPELNQIKKAKFSTQGIIGLLSKYDIEVE